MKRASYVFVCISLLVAIAYVYAGPDQHVDNPANVASDIQVYSETFAATTSIIAADATYKYRILSFSIVPLSATSQTIRISNGDNNLFGTAAAPLKVDMDNTDGPNAIIYPHNPAGWFETDTANEAVAVTLGSTEAVHVTCTYVKIR
jgi:hypothetical protein